MQYYIEENKVTVQEYCNAINTQFYDEVKNDDGETRKLVFNLEKKKTQLRRQREYVFKNGFEPYKSNVRYGIETETEEQHQKVIEWYNNMLDITHLEEALENIPDRIKYYLGGLKE